MHPIDAAVELGRRHDLRDVEPIVLKDGSNLVIHLAPAPVVVRVATFTGWVRGDPRPYLGREVALATALAGIGARVAPAGGLIPPGPHAVGGWHLSVTEWIDHQPNVVPHASDALIALDALHAHLDRVDVPLPYLGPVRDDLDRAWAQVERLALMGRRDLEDRRAQRDRLVRDLGAAAPERRRLHGDAFPRNSLAEPSGTIVWIDFEDACSGPAAWDHAVLIRQGGDRSLEPGLRERDGDAAIDAALALRELQLEAWMVLHDARAAGRLPIPPSYRRSSPA